MLICVCPIDEKCPALGSNCDCFPWCEYLYEDGVFENYGGKKRFDVSHPDFRDPLRVAAPNEDAAIVAAAKVRGVPWQKYEFYAYCEVFRV